MLRRILAALTGSTPTKKTTSKYVPGSSPAEQDIIAAIDPWILACAVGAQNGSTGSSMGYSYWFDESKKNWLVNTMFKTKATEGEVRAALTRYVLLQGAKHYKLVFEEENRIRGTVPELILGPNEAVTITMPFGKA